MNSVPESSMRNLLLAVLLPLLTLGLGACGSSGTESTRLPDAGLEDGLLTGAVSGDEWLAEAALATGSRAARLYLNAAQAYLAEQRFDALGAALASVELPPGRAELNERYTRLRAAWHFSQNDIELAQQWLYNAAPPRRERGGRRSATARAQNAAADDYWLLVAAISETLEDWATTASALAQIEDATRHQNSPWFAERRQLVAAAGETPALKNVALMGGQLESATAPAATTEAPDELLVTLQQGIRQGRERDNSAPLDGKQDDGKQDDGERDNAAAARQSLHDHLWLALNRTQRASALTAATTAAPQERGWWTLRLEVAAAQRLDDRRAVLRRWQRQHGGHPGAYPWPSALQQLAQTTEPVEPLEVALLLPLSGPLSAAGNAIRDGFIATQLEAELPLIARFYDVAAAPLPQLLETAAASADVIIGPVTKDRVSELARLGLEQPTLALNYLDAGRPEPVAKSTTREPTEGAVPAPLTGRDNLLLPTEPVAPETIRTLPFQLGIAIEDEAKTLIKQLERSGVERLLVIHGPASWAERAAKTITSGWSGYLRTAQFESVKTVTESIGSGMLIDDSHRRAQQLRQTIGEHIEFTPRARQDLDAIVALVSPVEAEALRPALRFHFADRVPVFSTSQLLRSRDIQNQPGLSGIQLTELPGLLEVEGQARTFNEAFGLPESQLSGLYTLGADAARLAEHLPLLKYQSAFAFDGATGALTLATDGRRLQRELGWAVLSQGRARPAPTVQERVSPIAESALRNGNTAGQ